MGLSLLISMVNKQKMGLFFVLRLVLILLNQRRPVKGFPAEFAFIGPAAITSESGALLPTTAKLDKRCRAGIFTERIQIAGPEQKRDQGPAGKRHQENEGNDVAYKP